MKRALLVVLTTLALAACSKDSTGPADPNGHLKIQNNSSVILDQVFYSECSNLDWGAERLAGAVISPGQSRTFTVTPGCWDIWVLNSTTSLSVQFRGDTVTAGQTYTATVTN